MGTAKYNDIAEILRRDILSGKFENGLPFPTGGEIAERFGVSRPTVNRVMLELRNEGLVSTHSGSRPRLTRFARHATGALGIIHPGFQYGGVLSEICESIVRQGERLGWDIVLIELSETSPSRRFDELLRAIRRFSDERVAGLFLQPFEYLKREASFARRFWNELSACGMPVVLLDYDPQHGQGAQYDLVSMDNFRAGYRIGNALLQKGSQRIAFLLKAGSPPSVVDRMRGVSSAVVENGGEWSGLRNVLACDPDDCRRISGFMRKCNPDAIVCGNDTTAVRLHATLSALKLAGSVRLAGFDNQPEAAALGITSVVQPSEEIASIALHALLARLRSPSLPVHTLLVPDGGVVR